MSIDSKELRELMDDFLNEVVDYNDHHEFHFPFCSLLTYVVEKEMKENADIVKLDKQLNDIESKRNKLANELMEITTFNK